MDKNKDAKIPEVFELTTPLFDFFKGVVDIYSTAEETSTRT